MSLSATLKPVFNSGDRNRGVSYYHNGHVGDLTVFGDLLVAEVEGNYDQYSVTIELDGYQGESALTCTCARFEDGYYCKHIWATILRYEELLARGDSDRGTGSRTARKKPGSRRAKQARVPGWQALLKCVSAVEPDFNYPGKPSGPLQIATAEDSEILYVVDAGQELTWSRQKIELSILQRIRKKSGQWGNLKPLGLSHRSMNEIVSETDRQVAAQLLGVDREHSTTYHYGSLSPGFSSFGFDSQWSRELCDLLVNSGRFFWTLDSSLPVEDFYPLESIDFANPGAISLDIQDQARPRGSAVAKVSIRVQGQLLDNDEVVRIADNGIVLLKNRLIRVSNPDAVELWKFSRDRSPVEIRKSDREPFLKQLSGHGTLPPVQFPESWQVNQSDNVRPNAVLNLEKHGWEDRELGGSVTFRYAGTEISPDFTNAAIYDEESHCWIARNPECEEKLLAELAAFPISGTPSARLGKHDFVVHKKHLVRMVDELGQRGWTVQLHGKQVRQAGQFDISVESGQDWFDLAVAVNFDGETIPLPRLLQAISRKENFIVLADGSRGRIPADVIEKYSRIAGFGQIEKDKIRFRPTQAMLLDAMLDSRDVAMDRGFQNFRRKLRSFKGVQSRNPPRGFQGELRKYQSEGLGWLHFLRDFQLGGCLADDMGLGKTIQVLSLLEQRRTRRIPPASKPATGKKGQRAAKKTSAKKTRAKKSKSGLPAIVEATVQLKRKPSIVVVPKSLIFNWIEEGTRFTPRLRFLNYTGTRRRARVGEAVEAGGFDVLITTYGTMQKDIAELSHIEFDYAILDESQAIKNSRALCARSSRLLKADHRLAMTGTPIENHLGELWSLFEFLNPGMLGSSAGFARLTNQKKSNASEREETLAALSRGLQPFLLRRTKEQVLKDLPPKTEQTLYCDMLPGQKKAYQELREYYRVKLAKKVETEGIGQSKIQVLEALLRLRQVACDPRLLDKSAKPGAKLELLRQQITDIASEGHKVLVFSQFTSFLALVKQQFDREGICYEYLDGKSSKRGARVRRFQEDESVTAFLISIKAGGHGLNLTSADYVFLLDPWWNPAVEAQAIDRAHRLGQENPVIAYRMVCRDTVEEKIIELQKSKRELVDKVVRSDESIIRSLTSDDLLFFFG